MATILNRTTTFPTNGTVTAAGLHNLIDDTSIYAGLITTQTELTTVGTADQLLIAVNGVSDTGAPRRATVQNLFDDALTSGTYTNLSLSGALTYGTATGNYTVSTSATITTGTIPNLTAGTTTSTAATITTAVIPTLTTGTTTSTAEIVTSGTILTLNSTTGTITNLRSTTGTVATLNSTTGTITNLSTTLAGDFTISQGTGALATTGATAGVYGSASAIPFITIDAKGRVTAATTGTFSTTPADGSITAPKLSGAQSGSAPIFGARAWVNFDGTRNEGDTGASTNGANVKIRGSGNVASVLKNSAGNYTATFTVAMADASYAVSLASALGNNHKVQSIGSSTCNVIISDGAFTPTDTTSVYISIFR